MLNLRHYKIGTRLIMTTIGALALMIVFVAIALFSLNSVGEKVDHITDNNFKKTEQAVDMRVRNLLISRHVRTARFMKKLKSSWVNRKRSLLIFRCIWSWRINLAAP